MRRAGMLGRAEPRCDGGVRPAARCPSSVRSRSQSVASACAARSCSGLARLPPAVRGDFPLRSVVRISSVRVAATGGGAASSVALRFGVLVEPRFRVAMG